MQCPKCRNEVADAVRYCGSCGTALLAACPVCGQGNPQGGRFCQQCGSETASAAPGLFLEKALAWRGQFERMGWCKDPTGIPPGARRVMRASTARKIWCDEVLPTCYSTLLRHNIPEAHDRTEPWLFFFPLRISDWEIDRFEARIRTEYADYPDYVDGMGFLLATRCRLIFVQTSSGSRRHWLEDFQGANQFRVYQWLYKEINEGQVKENGDVRLWTEKGDSIYCHVRTKGVRLIDRAVAVATAGGQRQAQYLVAVSNIASSTETKMDFLSVIQEFCRDIVAVGSPGLT